jgi:hypothetical protein
VRSGFVKSKKTLASRRTGTRLRGQQRALQILELVGDDAEALALIAEIGRFIIRRDRGSRRRR